MNSHLNYDVFVFFVSGLCKPGKSAEDPNYEDDPPYEGEDDEEEDDENEDADNLGVAEDPPKILSKPESFYVVAGSDVALPCDVIHTGLQNNRDPFLFMIQYRYVIVLKSRIVFMILHL